MRRFEFSEGSSDKFWQVSRDGTTLRVQFGRIGSTGQIKLKTCATEAAAEAEMAKLVAEKTKKGYREVSASATSATASGGSLARPAASAATSETSASLLDPKELDAAKTMAAALDNRSAAPKVRAFFDGRPDLAVAALAPIVASRHKLAVFAEPLLKGYLRAHPELATKLAPVLDARSQSALARLAADTAAPDEVVGEDELPSVLRTPPWANRAPKKREPPTVAIAAFLPFEARIHWPADAKERALKWGDTMLAQYRQMAPVGAKGPMPPGMRTAAIDAWGADRIRIGHTWNVTGLIHAMSDAAVLGLIDEGGSLGGPEPSYLLARFGDRVLDFVRASIGDDPELTIKQLANVESPRLALPVANALAKKRFRDDALLWLLAYPEAAAIGLIPAALGKAKKERGLAQAALRALAARNRSVVEDVARRYGDAVAAATNDVLDASVDEIPDRLPELPQFFDPATLPPPRIAGARKALPEAAIRTLGTMLQLSPLERPLSALADVKEACDPRSLSEFAWALFQAWLSMGADSKQNWAFAALGHFGDDDTARKLTPLIRAWPGESQHARAVMGLDVLAAIGSDVALMHLHGIAQKVKFKGLQEKAREKMQTVADARSLTAAELADRLVPDLGLDDDGTLVLDFGPRTFKVGFDPQLVPIVVDASGKRLADLPKPGKSDDADKAGAAVETWKALKKDAKAVSATQVLRLEMLMCDARRIPAASFRLFFVEHPLLIHVVRRVVWGVYDGTKLVATFRVAEDRSLADANDDTFTLADDAAVGVVHRLELDDATTARWGQVFSDYEILQPFDQLGRAVFTPTDTERAENALKRLEGAVVKTGRVLGLDGRGWRKGTPQDAGWIWDVYKPLPGGIVAELPIEGGIAAGYMEMTPPEQKLGVVTLRHADEWQPSKTLTFGALAPATFSELVRDLESLRA